MLLETFCVTKDDKRTAQSFKMGNLTGMSCGRRDVSGLYKGQRTPQLQSLLGLAETPGKHQIPNTLHTYGRAEKTG